MLSKTAMLLVPASSLVGAAALAPTTSLAESGENHGFIAVNYSYCQENAWDSKCRGALPPTLAPRSVAKVGEWFPRAASSAPQKKLNRAR
jgi:hypothetical protein